MTSSTDFDVAIVGYGPVGQALSLMFGQAGYRVGVFERWPTLYPLPRACVVDHEAMRNLQRLGVADEFAKLTVPANGGYLWVNADNETLYHFQYDPNGLSGWPSRSLMYQPELEQVLDRAARATATIDLNLGWQASELKSGPGGVELTLQAGETDSGGHWTPVEKVRRVTARHVIGADGANSFVRMAMGSALNDLGFRAEWLVIDFRPNDPAIALDMPEAGQICDPARPITVMRHLGLNHVRWEVMLLPGEKAADMMKPEAVWPLIARWVGPQDGTIARAAVYTFKSAIAETWISNAISLAGDSAHLMPPFLGQGLCSGLRDALSLFWRLDLILRGIAGEGLLASYELERKSHVTALIERAVALGKVVCITDPRAAAERDQAILDGKAPPLPPLPRLNAGLVGRLGRPADAVVGDLALQARVAKSGRSGRFDEIVGAGWQIITLDEALDPHLTPSQRLLLQRIGARSVAFGAANEAVDDVDGAYRSYMERLGVRLLIVRPDFYVFGAADDVRGGCALISQLESGLCLQIAASVAAV